MRWSQAKYCPGGLFPALPAPTSPQITHPLKGQPDIQNPCSNPRHGNFLGVLESCVCRETREIKDKDKENTDGEVLKDLIFLAMCCSL